jgi:hypothetical protein
MARNLARAEGHLHQAAQAAPFFKRQVAVSLAHGDPGHSRCRTWFVNLALPKTQVALELARGRVLFPSGGGAGS